MYMQNNFKEEQSLIIASLSQEKLLWILSQIFEIKLTSLTNLPSDYTQQDIKNFMDSIPSNFQENTKIMMIKTYNLESILKCYQNMFEDMTMEMNQYSPVLLRQHALHYLSNFSSHENKLLIKRIQAISI